MPAGEGSAYLSPEPQEAPHPEAFVGAARLTCRKTKVRIRFHFNPHGKNTPTAWLPVSLLPMLLQVTPLCEGGWSSTQPILTPKGAANVSRGQTSVYHMHTNHPQTYGYWQSPANTYLARRNYLTIYHRIQQGNWKWKYNWSLQQEELSIFFSC